MTLRLLLPLVALTLGLSLLAQAPAPAHAHPQGNFTINRYARIELYQGLLRIYYVLDYSEIPSLQWSIAHDADGNGAVDERERERFSVAQRDEVLSRLTVRSGESALSLTPVSANATVRAGDLGVEILRFEAVFEAAIDGGMQDIVVHDGNLQGVAGWKALTVRPSEGTVAAFAAELLEDPSDSLTVFPPAWLDFPPRLAGLNFSWDPRTGIAAPTSAESAAPAPLPSSPGRLGRLVGGAGSPLSVLVALVVAFVLGMVDALGPGHGKTAVGSYLVGRSSRLRDAFLIGGAAALAHLFAVGLIGALVLTVSAVFLPARAFQGLAIVSGALVVGLGAVLLFGRIRSRGSTHAGCSCHPAGRREATSVRGVLVVGIAGGLVPCPTAIILVLAAVSLQRLALGAALALAFSVGAATVLVGVGLGVVLARRMSLPDRGRPALRRAAAALPVASACLVMLAGILITQQALTNPGL